MPRLFRFRTSSRTAILVASWAAILTLELPCTAGQNKPMPTADVSQQLPDEPAPIITSPPRAPLLGAFRNPMPHSSKARFWRETAANAQITVAENTLIRVMTNEPISTNDCRAGDPLSFTVIDDVLVDDVLIIPRGAALHGAVVQCKQSGPLTGSPSVIVKLTSLALEGRNYPLYSYHFKVDGESKAKKTETNATGGVVIGGLLGNAVRKNRLGETSERQTFKYVASGAAVGAGSGMILSAVTSGPFVMIPAESQLDFYLASPVSIVPVSSEEAERLLRLARSNGPVLFVRGETP